MNGEPALFEDEHRNRGMGQDMLGFAAQQQAFDALSSVGRHDDQVALMLLGC